MKPTLTRFSLYAEGRSSPLFSLCLIFPSAHEVGRRWLQREPCGMDDLALSEFVEVSSWKQYKVTLTDFLERPVLYSLISLHEGAFQLSLTF